MSLSRRKRRKNAKINNTLLIILLVTMLVTIIAFVLNMIRIRNVDTGEGETIQETEEPDNEYANDYYSIGYNATEINKEYFRVLDTAVEDALSADTAENSEDETASESSAVRDNAKIAEYVVRCFITEYYTWTNKDGNYDVGGMQYIYTDRQKDFETYTRYNFYADMDLYLTQYDRESLIQVKEVTINSVSQTEGLTISEGGPSYECWKVDASWTYEEGSSMDTSAIQNHAVFHVVNHNGRLEIAGINREEAANDASEWY